MSVAVRNDFRYANNKDDSRGLESMKRTQFDWTSMFIYFIIAFVLITILNTLGYELPWYGMILLFLIIWIAVTVFVNMVRRDRAKKMEDKENQ